MRGVDIWGDIKRAVLGAPSLTFIVGRRDVYPRQFSASTKQSKYLQFVYAPATWRWRFGNCYQTGSLSVSHTRDGGGGRKMIAGCSHSRRVQTWRAPRQLHQSRILNREGRYWATNSCTCYHVYIPSTISLFSLSKGEINQFKLAKSLCNAINPLTKQVLVKNSYPQDKTSEKERGNHWFYNVNDIACNFTQESLA